MRFVLKLGSPDIVFSTHSWRETGDGHWTGVMGGRVWTLTQTDDRLWYHVYNNNDNKVAHKDVDHRKRKGAAQQLNKSEKKRKINIKEEENDELVTVTVKKEGEEEMLVDYFQLNVNLEELYRDWGLADPHFKHISNIFTGK